MMSKGEKNIELPTLEFLLAERGIIKSPVYGDYQDYIEARSKKLKAVCLNAKRLFSSRSMHLALGRITKINRF